MISRVAYASGIIALTASGGTAEEFAMRLAEEATAAAAGFAYIFHSTQLFTSADLAATIARHSPKLNHVGCSTAGEITPDGLEEGHAVALLFPKASFTFATKLIENVSSAGMEAVTGAVEELRRDLSRAPRLAGAKTFAVCLIDGLSYAEEAITSAMHWGLDDIPLIGGSAGDDLKFVRTEIFCEGAARSDAVAIMLCSTAVPFRVFKTDNFVPTDIKLVVTASDPEHRIVHELNAESASVEYAKAIGMDHDSLSPLSFATHPVVVRVGGEYYCRSIQKVNPDGSLSFFCAIDDGIVLTIARPTGMVESTRKALREVSEQLGGTDMILGFECTHRRLDAQNRQIYREVSELYRQNNVIGFATYGEQYRSMHLNQTFTGIAFGAGQQAAE